jgi:hypothetical protein
MIYIITITFPNPKNNTKKLCFVDNGLVYSISLSNYDTTYTENIFDSLKFIKQPIQKENTGTMLVLENFQSIPPNPISSLYNSIMISGHSLFYSGIFRLELPTHLQFRESFYP